MWLELRLLVTAINRFIGLVRARPRGAQYVSKKLPDKTHKQCASVKHSFRNGYSLICIKMEPENLKVLRLHEHPEYLKPCCELINTEWPRSETARMMSLQASCDYLPTSLILINDMKHLLGHCKLTPIPSIPDSCFIETVVISKLMRGKKLGSFLMRQVEEYCIKVLKLRMLHLSTKGQEIFYAKLGYEVCAPVSIFGRRYINSEPTVVSDKIQNPVPIDSSSQVGPPPPPPPPMPKPDILVTSNTLKSTKTYMFKYL